MDPVLLALISKYGIPALKTAFEIFKAVRAEGGDLEAMSMELEAESHEDIYDAIKKRGGVVPDEGGN